MTGLIKDLGRSYTGIRTLIRLEEKSGCCCLRIYLEQLCLLLLSLEPPLVICPETLGVLYAIASYRATERAAQMLKQTHRV